MYFCLLKKDWLCLSRSPGTIAAAFGLAVVCTVISGFCFRRVGVSDFEMRGLVPGVVWLSFLFSSLAILSQSMWLERRNRALEACLSLGVDGGKVFFSKLTINYLLISILGLFIIVASSLFISPLEVGEVMLLFMICLLASGGFSAIGTLLALVSGAYGGREFLLPLILYPLIIPLLAASIACSHQVLSGDVSLVNDFWFQFIFLFDLVFISLSWYLSDFLLSFERQ